MLPNHVKDALDAILGDLNLDEADKKRKKYAPPEEEGKPHHGVTITIVTGGKHPEPDGDEGKVLGKGVAEPLESPEELEKLLGGDEEAEPEEEEPKDDEEEKRPKKKLRRY